MPGPYKLLFWGYFVKASLVKGRWPEGPEGFRRALPSCPSHSQTGRNPSAVAALGTSL